jgi:hypothetical protein
MDGNTRVLKLATKGKDNKTDIKGSLVPTHTAHRENSKNLGAKHQDETYEY